MRATFPVIAAILLLFLLLSLAAARLSARLHPFYRRPWVQGLSLGLSCAAIGALSISRWFHPTSTAAALFNFVLYGAYAWLMGQLILLLIGLPLWAITAAGAKMRPSTPPAPATGSISRRQLLQGALAAVPLLAIGGSVHTVYTTSTVLAVRRFNLAWPNLPPSLDGYKIVQISDTHLGPFFSLAQFDRVLALAQRERPDLVAITGDLADDLSLLAPAMERLTRLAPTVPDGLYFCWGNHEYFRDIGLIRRALAASPVQLLENSHVVLRRGPQPFCLAGVDYPWARRGPELIAKCQTFTDRALAGIPADSFTILLAHHPDFLADGFARGLPLTLAGHTHGGQVIVAGQSLLPVHYLYMRGLYRQGDSYGYVNSGAGSWFPFRVNCPAEIAVFTLLPQSRTLSGGV